MKNSASWNSHDIYTIKIVGSWEWVRRALLTLVDDFNEPKFGYNGELWDEE